MKLLRIYALAYAILCLVQGAGYAANHREHRIDCRGQFQADEMDFPWQSQGPLQFIETLKLNSHDQILVQCFHEGWVQRGDIENLIALLDSETPCSSVASGFSSLFAPGSTVGHEAAYLIEGFRKGTYPPTLNSTTWIADTDEITRWWAKEKANPTSECITDTSQ